LCIFNHRVARLHCKAVPQTIPSNIRSGIIISQKIQLRIVYTTILETLGQKESFKINTAIQPVHHTGLSMIMVLKATNGMTSNGMLLPEFQENWGQ